MPGTPKAQAAIGGLGSSIRFAVKGKEAITSVARHIRGNEDKAGRVIARGGIEPLSDTCGSRVDEGGAVFGIAPIW